MSVVIVPGAVNDILYQMDEYNKHKSDKKRFWKLLENTFNLIIGDNYVVAPKYEEICLHQS